MEIMSFISGSHSSKPVFLSSSYLRELYRHISGTETKYPLVNCIIDCDGLTATEVKLILKNAFVQDSILYMPLSVSKSIIKSNILDLDTNSIINNSYTLETLAQFDSFDDEIISRLDLSFKDLRKYTIPDNSNFFQLIKDKSLVNTKLPLMDLSKYDLKDVNFTYSKFDSKTILPENFFQVIKGKYLKDSTLPAIDFSNYDVTGCIFEFIKFNKNTRFPKDSNFFKKFHRLYGCSFPCFDYREYDFKNVDLRFCTFASNSKLPYSQDLLSQFSTVKCPSNYVDKLHLFPFSEGSYDMILFNYSSKLSDEQKIILYKKLLD